MVFKDLVHDADDFVEVLGFDVMPGAYDLGGDFEKLPVLVNHDVTVRDSMLEEKAIKTAKGDASNLHRLAIHPLCVVIMHDEFYFRAARFLFLAFIVCTMVIQAEVLSFLRLFDFVEEGESGKFFRRSEKMGLVIGEGSCSSESGLECVEYSRAGDLFCCFFNDGGMRPPFCQLCNVLKYGLHPFGIISFILILCFIHRFFLSSRGASFPHNFFTLRLYKQENRFSLREIYQLFCNTMPFAQL